MFTDAGLSQEESALLTRLFMKIQKQKKPDRINERYYKGLQEIGNLGISVPPDVQAFAFPLNWCRTYVDVLTERQDVRMILRSGETAEDSDLRRDWEANDLDVEQQLLNRDLAVYGRGFISVAADPDGGRPMIRVESPTDLAAEVHPLTRQMLGALRLYRTDDQKVEFATFYLPNRTLFFKSDLGRWQRAETVEHGLGRVPIVMALTRRSSGSWEGESMLTDLKPLVDMAGRVMLQLQLAMETTATPQKVALGVKQKDFQDEDGNSIDPWDAYLGAVWALADNQADVKQLAGADLSGFHDTIRMLAEQASTVTGLPVRMMGQRSANPPAEGAIRADEARLVKQVERLNSVAGMAWSWALGIAERIRTHRWSADGQIQVQWHDPATPTVAQRADAIQKLSGGVPVLSIRGAMIELGFTQQRIDQELQWMQQEMSGMYTTPMDRKLERVMDEGL